MDGMTPKSSRLQFWLTLFVLVGAPCMILTERFF
jgi:hypothetical protein